MAKKIKTKCRFRSEDLRWLLVRSTLAIVIMAFATYFCDYLFDTIILVRYGQHLQPINFFVTYPNP
jgi:sec-independent protein translocase protein TatC